MTSKNFCRREIIEIWHSKDPKNTLSLHSIPLVCDEICQRIGLCGDATANQSARVREKVAAVCYKIRARWSASGRSAAKFENKNREWLDTVENFALEPVVPTVEKRKICQRAGRPTKPFEDVDPRTKRRKAHLLVKQASTSELALATEFSARAEGKIHAAKLVNQALLKSPNRAVAMCSALQQQEKARAIKGFTEDEAVAFCINNNFSKSVYQDIRNESVSRGNPNMYPPYKNLKEARLRALPAAEEISISEKKAEVSLQGLLDHTAKRLIDLRSDVIKSFNETEMYFSMHSKWGFDGTSNDSQYMQNFSDQSVSDMSIVLTSMVPLLIHVTEKPNIVVYWNAKSSSTRYCRPIKMEFAKETKEFSKAEYQKVSEQIDALQPTVHVVGNCTVHITHTLQCTMIDGKMCSALTDVPCQSCCVCNGKPKEFNNIDEICRKPVNRSTFRFGLSPLHFSIRALEYLLHVSYRLDFKQTEAKGPEKQLLMKERKKKVQEKLKEKLGILVDVPKHGSGTTNTGNVARRFFKDPAITAEALELNEMVVSRIGNTVQVLNSGYAIDTEKFRKDALETAKLCVAPENYGWYRMPPAVHRVLIHGADIIDAAQIPIGSLSEEPQESLNKDLKRFRRMLARKTSRLASQEDVFRRLLLASDPILSSYKRHQPRKRSGPLPAAVRNLLKPISSPDIPSHEVSDNSDIDETDSVCSFN